MLNSVSRLKTQADGCGWRTLGDLSASQAEEWLLRQQAPRGVVVLPAGQEAFTPSQTAKLLGIRLQNVRKAVKRHRLEATGLGKARRYPRATVAALLDLQNQGMSAQTRNYYRIHLKTFGNFLMKDRRLGSNPFRHLEAENALTDRRHDRRELEVDELRRVLAAARTSIRIFSRLTGNDRFHLYVTACGTGFRASALASLTPESFDLDAPVATVTLAARNNKSRQRKVQPLPPRSGRSAAGVSAGQARRATPLGRDVGSEWQRSGNAADRPGSGRHSLQCRGTRRPPVR